MSTRSPLYRIQASPSSNPAVMGAEHSRGPRDYTDPVETWERHGFRIKSTVPVVPARSRMRMLEDMRLTVIVECKKPVPLRSLSAYCWTNVFDKDNLEGVFHEINLPYEEGSRAWDDWGLTTYKFSYLIYPTHNTECRFSFYAKLGNIVQWVNKPEVDHILDVLSPKDNNSWTKSVSQAQITKHIFLGNIQAEKNASSFGFDVILKFCNEKVPRRPKIAEGKVPQFFHPFNEESGAGYEIPAARLFDLVGWLEGNRDNYEKILMADDFGLGRVGSAMTAYIFATNPNLTFEEAYNFVKSRKEVYCHKGLKDTLLALFPRE